MEKFKSFLLILSLIFIGIHAYDANAENEKNVEKQIEDSKQAAEAVINEGSIENADEIEAAKEAAAVAAPVNSANYEIKNFNVDSSRSEKKLGKTKLSFELYSSDKVAPELSIYYQLTYSENKNQVDKNYKKWRLATIHKADKLTKAKLSEDGKVKKNSYIWLSKNDLGTGIYMVDLKVVLNGSPEKEFTFVNHSISNRPEIKAFLFPLIGGLGIFLLGMLMMSEGLQAWAGDSLRQLIKAVTNNRFMALTVGVLVTCIVQSSSVTTVMTVGFVNAGLMTLKQAIGIVFGANIGTTITGWIIAIKITKYSLLFLGAGVALKLFSKRETFRYVGQIMMGFGMVFFGLSLMKNGFAPLKTDPLFSAWFMKFQANSYGEILICMFIGCVLTIIVQSSSATLGITIAMATEGLISYETAVALVLGENIGTTVTSWLASLKTNLDAKRVARVHMLFNFTGALYMSIIFPVYIVFIDKIVPGEASNVEHITVHIAMAHTVFNITNAVFFIPFVNQIERLVCWLTPQKNGGKQKTKLVYLSSDTIIESPSIALEEAYQELKRMAEITKNMMVLSFELFKSENNKERINRIFKYEKITDNIQYELSKFLFKLFPTTITKEEAKMTRRFLVMAEEFESIADNFERITKYYNRLRSNDRMKFNDDLQKDLDQIFGLCQNLFEVCHAGLLEKKRDTYDKAEVISDHINRLADEIRERHVKRMESQEFDPNESLIFSDIIIACRRMKNHGQDLAKALSNY